MPAAGAFPLNAVVGQEEIRTALLLLAVDADLGGVVIAGRRGTAKSVMARGVAALLPPIRAIRSSCCHADPADPDDWDDATRARRAAATRALPSRWMPAPFVEVPLGVSEDRLLGSVDVAHSIRQGRPVFQPGLLAEAHRGVLYVDEFNLLEPALAHLLLNALADGVNRVEREGISFRHPCRARLIATYNPAEGELRAHWLDRFAIVLSADRELPLPERREAVERALAHAGTPEAFWSRFGPGLEELRLQVERARRALPRVVARPEQVAYLVEEATRAGAEGQRGELFALRVARSHAALRGRAAVEAEDLRRAVELVIVPRALSFEAPPPPQAPPEAAPPPPEAAPERESEPGEEPQEPETPEQATVPPEFLFSPEGVLLEEGLLAAAHRSLRRHGKAGGGGVVRSRDRGRYVKPVPPLDTVHRLAVDATLRAAAPHQMARRRALGRRRARLPRSGGRVLLRQEDLREKQLVRRAGALVIFLVDASGSMARNRMQAAKGAALRLLGEAYRSRDRIALVVFRGERAEVLLPPTRSITAASRRLERLPCGGGSPLAHGLALAVRLGENARRQRDVSDVVIVLLSDGKANVTLERSLAPPGTNLEAGVPEALREEVLRIGGVIGDLAMRLVVIDTGNPYLSSGLPRELAQRSGGIHHLLPRADPRGLTALTREMLQRA